VLVICDFLLRLGELLMQAANKLSRKHGVVLVEPNTGEVLTFVKHRANERAGYGAPFATVFDRGLEHLGAHMKHVLDYQVLFWLLTKRRLGWVDYGEVSGTQVVAELGMSQASASRALVRLTAIGVLERQNRGGAGKGARYRLNPYYFWRGPVEHYHAARVKRGSAAVPKQADLGEQLSDVVPRKKRVLRSG
jgi:DNA-binding transcriptional ArsR family regulator